MKNVLLIINPKAGKMKAKTTLFDIIDTLTEHNMRVTVEITRYGGHAAELCMKECGNYDMIVCAGGDGTLNEAVGGLISAESDTPLGYIPSGSTNDFASTLNLSKDPREAALDISEGIERTLDVGMFGDRFFTYVASFGAFTKSSYSTPQDTKNTLGHLAYILEGIKEISSIRAEHVKIDAKNGVVYEDDFIFGAIANSTSVGGIISFDDRMVTMNDGKFELLLIKKPKNLIELNKCINSLITQNYESDMIIFDNIDSAYITSENPLTWSLDGERADTDGSVHVKNLNNAIKMILPYTIKETSIV
ncbi:MAG: YegS/Rv2252/BmrU family lipid kinase [Clostridiales bacterium]|nr:YegS/Rv2252/BmrU family lipid kinase [Clostridiales bacterium]